MSADARRRRVQTILAACEPALFPNMPRSPRSVSEWAYLRRRINVLTYALTFEEASAAEPCLEQLCNMRRQLESKAREDRMYQMKNPNWIGALHPIRQQNALFSSSPPPRVVSTQIGPTSSGRESSAWKHTSRSRGTRHRANGSSSSRTCSPSSLCRSRHQVKCHACLGILLALRHIPRIAQIVWA
jgi:hypothetical protein